MRKGINDNNISYEIFVAKLGQRFITLINLMIRTWGHFLLLEVSNSLKLPTVT